MPKEPSPFLHSWLVLVDIMASDSWANVPPSNSWVALSSGGGQAWSDRLKNNRVGSNVLSQKNRAKTDDMSTKCRLSVD